MKLIVLFVFFAIQSYAAETLTECSQMSERHKRSNPKHHDLFKKKSLNSGAKGSGQ